MKSAAAGLLWVVALLVLVPLASAATWYANGLDGNDNNNCLSALNACKTIGHAISLAAVGDTIYVAAATYSENLTISMNLTVIGAGAATTVIDGGGVGRVVTISNAAAHVNLSKVTIQHGFAVTGGGISNAGILTISNSIVTGNKAHDSSSPGGMGGGIFNRGILTVNKTIVSGNIAGGLAASGGGINSFFGKLTINNSTISGNIASGEYSDGLGGGIAGSATINKSTISGNFANQKGGGIYGAVIISNSTISSNSAPSGGGVFGSGSITNSTISGNSAIQFFGGGISANGQTTISNSTISGNSAPDGGGIYLYFGSVIVQNTILANSPSGGNCAANITSNGYNLSSDSSCNFSGPGDMNNIDPMLGPLQNNGGPTQTMALPSGSPAIDAGNPTGCTDSTGHLLRTDQRGFPRPDAADSAGCDMGAYERQAD